jgi:hypothetical protein
MSEDKYKLIIESLDTLDNIISVMKVNLDNYINYIKYLIKKDSLSELLEKTIDENRYNITELDRLTYGISILKDYLINNERVNDLVFELECFIEQE